VPTMSTAAGRFTTCRTRSSNAADVALGCRRNRPGSTQ
jgi:hypothetical protein